MGQSWYTPANVEEDGREACDKLPGLKGEVVLQRRRLSGEEELSNDNGTERWGNGAISSCTGEGRDWELGWRDTGNQDLWCRYNEGCSV